ncbi:MAG: beta-lactamase family protein [Caldilineaceae bacterium]|nr:beta-lactamase family protein [Caldilineaceae bacterium]
MLADQLLVAVQGKGTAGVAVIDGVDGVVDRAWVPQTLTAEPRFLAYSITKSFIATLILRLQERRLLTLDDRLALWFPALPQAANISLRHLLNHTGGIPDYGGFPAYHAALRTNPTQAWTVDDYLTFIRKHGLRFAPGTGWAYANPGYLLLKRIAELVSGQPFAALVNEQIVQPLALRDTFVAETVADLSSLAPAPTKALSPDGEWLDTRLHYHPGWVSHGVVAATPSAIATFYHALFRGKLLSPESLQAMTTFVRVPSAHAPWVEPSYGLGIMGDPASPVGVLWGHGGGGPGYAASAFHMPDLYCGCNENRSFYPSKNFDSHAEQSIAGRPVTVCVLSAIEGGFDVEALAREILAQRLSRVA